MTARQLALHGLAIKRHSTADAVASLVGVDAGIIAAELGSAAATGRVVEIRGAFSLTPLARVALEAGYDLEFGVLRSDAGFAAGYEAFERINPDLKQVITDWQTVPVRGDRQTNDHADPDYDTRIIDRLAAVHERAEPVLAALARGLPRLSIYTSKLAEALDRAEVGEIDWVSDIHRDSYHTVWFELHEDLLRIMNRTRSE